MLKRDNYGMGEASINNMFSQKAHCFLRCLSNTRGKIFARLSPPPDIKQRNQSNRTRKDLGSTGGIKRWAFFTSNLSSHLDEHYSL
jgi:hypothetical protein